MTPKTTIPNPEKCGALAFRVVGDLGGAFTAALGYIGDRLGLFRALAGAGPLSSAQLADRTRLHERYVREWARAMVAAEYLDYDAAADRYLMTPEQESVLADEDSPFFAGGGLHLAAPSIGNVPRILEAFRHGGGIPYAELGEEIPLAIERFFRPGYVNFLVKDWLAAVPGLVGRLAAGARVADVGCGCGQSSVVMARAFPRSQIVAIDYDGPSLQRARRLAAAREAGNVEFVQGPAHELLRAGAFDLVCAFDCIHDMVDPLATLRAIRAALAADGVYLWAEPNASDRPDENRNPVGKLCAAISPLLCLTVSLAHGGAGLGTIIGERGARALARDAGFGAFDRLPIDNPFTQFFALRA